MSIEEYDSDEQLDIHEVDEDETELEAEGEAEGEGEQGFSSDDEEYGKKVRKRIGKEVSKRKVVESERDVYRREAEEAKREIAEMRSAQYEEEKGRLTKELEDDRKLASAALEEGETDKYLDYQDKMTDKKVKLSRSEQEQEFRDNARPGKKDNELSTAANGWMDENKEWIKKNPSKFKRAQRLSNMLEKEGYSVEDGDLYEELDKRLNQSQKPSQQDNLHVPTGDGGGEKNNKVRLTSEDKRLMTQYELDPNNAEHRKAWIGGRV